MLASRSDPTIKFSRPDDKTQSGLSAANPNQNTSISSNSSNTSSISGAKEPPRSKNA